MLSLQPTKRNVVSLSARFFDLLRIILPVSINFKMFFQMLCNVKVEWDQPLSGDLLLQWKRLCSAFEHSGALRIPRCYFYYDSQTSVTSVRLIGFCDASTRAYAAVVYLWLDGDGYASVRFLTAKTRVAPLTKGTMPRLELLPVLLNSW